MLGKLKSLIRRVVRKEENEVETLDVDEIVEKAKQVEMEEVVTESPWKDFKSLCKELGYDYREVIDKAAWYYVEETGGVDIDDPLATAEKMAEVLDKFDEVTRKISEPESLKKIREYKEVFKEVAEFKQALKEFKEGKLTARDLLPLLKNFMR